MRTTASYVLIVILIVCAIEAAHGSLFQKLRTKSKDNRGQNSLFYGMNKQEKKLFILINNYRQRNGLPLLQPSPNLAYVAHTHAIDIVENSPDVNGGNMHSWSNKGKWKAVRYTSDHKQAKLMWSKPSELTNYKFNGFEIAFGVDRNSRKITTMTPNRAINGWINSKAHNDVILEQGAFKSMPMKAMGVGIYKGFACVWFGQQIDKNSFKL